MVPLVEEELITGEKVKNEIQLLLDFIGKFAGIKVCLPSAGNAEEGVGRGRGKGSNLAK